MPRPHLHVGGAETQSVHSCRAVPVTEARAFPLSPPAPPLPVLPGGREPLSSNPPQLWEHSEPPSWPHTGAGRFQVSATLGKGPEQQTSAWGCSTTWEGETLPAFAEQGCRDHRASPVRPWLRESLAPQAQLSCTYHQRPGCKRLGCLPCSS